MISPVVDALAVFVFCRGISRSSFLIAVASVRGLLSIRRQTVWRKWILRGSVAQPGAKPTAHAHADHSCRAIIFDVLTGTTSGLGVAWVVIVPAGSLV